ncbi:tyrosyl-DNA phosphodiesterase, putative [Cordyceps militaris CM01]|uniref:Tyrosyl-DNA phosphodiesterase, putative n=1 Tax=Cordyceps militaris (strain CM01) TaxID=983644 RepID=G3JHB9_CORMM|nr:tyrosyl-DNA phosphodiesterase, putative [Cordyceps militaris CM01]EGX91675.1 tyrosyl-DNA phosphodiesterase, putative [Cordyceps militaris CM01]
MAEREVIILDSDSDEDDDLRRAIQLSLQDQSTMNDSAAGTCHETRNPEPDNNSKFGGILLNRKEMEEARLSRVGKRRRNSNESSTGEPAMKRPTPQPLERAASSRYPQGIVRRTWTKGYPKSSDDITIEEIFQKETLQLALLSSFQWDEEWLLSKLNISKTRILLLAFAANDEQVTCQISRNLLSLQPNLIRGWTETNNERKRAPEYPVLLPTDAWPRIDALQAPAPEIPKMVFLIDLPRLEREGGSEMTSFGENVTNFLTASGVDDAMSSPGGHTGDTLRRVGYCGLGETVRGLGLATDTPVEVDLACASLGSINGDLINAIYNACQGDDGMQEYIARAGRKLKNKEMRPAERLRDRFRIYFPTDQTVSKSKGGRQAKWWRSPSFPKELVRDCVNSRDGLLMHSKIIFVRRPAETWRVGEKSCTGWAYVGSANLSESAWGRVVKDRETGDAKMSCRNWECGVIVPVHGNPGTGGDFSMFSGVVPVPMKIPGHPYEKTDEPWFFLGDH